MYSINSIYSLTPYPLKLQVVIWPLPFRRVTQIWSLSGKVAEKYILRVIRLNPNLTMSQGFSQVHTPSLLKNLIYIQSYVSWKGNMVWWIPNSCLRHISRETNRKNDWNRGSYFPGQTQSNPKNSYFKFGSNCWISLISNKNYPIRIPGKIYGTLLKIVIWLTAIGRQN